MMMKTKMRDPVQAARRDQENSNPKPESEEEVMGLKPKVEGEKPKVVEEKRSPALTETGENPVEMEEMGDWCLAEAQEIRARKKKTEKEETKELLIIFGWV